MSQSTTARPALSQDQTQAQAQAQASSSRAARAAKVVAARLHKAAEGHVCACGGCRHHVLLVARAAGVTPDAVLEALGATAAAEEAKKAAGAPVRRALHAQVGAVATVRVAGRDLTLAEGLIAISQASAN